MSMWVVGRQNKMIIRIYSCAEDIYLISFKVAFSQLAVAKQDSAFFSGQLANQIPSFCTKLSKLLQDLLGSAVQYYFYAKE